MNLKIFIIFYFLHDKGFIFKPCEIVDMGKESSNAVNLFLSSSCHVDSLDSLLLPVPIGHSFWQVLTQASSICTELMNVGFVSLPILVCPYVVVYKRISHEFVLTSPAVFACLAHLSWMVCEMVGKWLYSCCFVECCFHDLFKAACNIFCVVPIKFFLWVFW